MHFGYNNSNNIFLLGVHILEIVQDEKDLGVMMRKDLKATSQCVRMVASQNGDNRNQHQNGDKPKWRQTETATNQNGDKNINCHLFTK